MGRRRSGQKVDLTADEITVWAENLSGMPVKDIAEKHGKPISTIYDWINRAKETVGTHDVEEMRACLYSLFPDAVDAIKHCLTRDKDGQIALRMLSGLTVLTDKREIEHSDKHHDKPDNELKQEIVDILDQETKDKTGTE